MALPEEPVLGRTEQLNRRLQQLLNRAIKETDPAIYDELCAEIWTVLDEKNRILVLSSL